MEILRAAVKFCIFLISTLFFYSLIMLVLFMSLFGLNYEFLRGYILNTWGKCCCFIFGIKLNIKGKAPQPEFFLVSNHLSYVDIFVLFSQVRGIFVAKSDVKTWPIIGFIIRSSGILFINRERKRDITRVNNLIAKNVNKNQGIIIFPESRTSPGVNILPFRSSLLEYPATIKLPVSYAVISYSTPQGEEDACKTVCWWADEPFFFHFFNLLKKKQINTTVTFGEQKVESEDRKELAILLYRYVQTDFVPVINPNNFNERFGALGKEKGISTKLMDVQDQ